MKKILMLLFCMFLIITCFAEESESVLVEGKGVDKETAKKDAFRIAIEKVIGIHLKSESKMDKFQIVVDKVSTKVSGFISKYKIYDEEHENGEFILTARVWVKKDLKDEVLKLIQDDFENRSIGIIVLLEDENSAKTKEEKILIEASNSARKKVASMFKEFWINEGFRVLSLKERTKYTKESKIIAGRTGLDKASYNLDEGAEYNIEINVEIEKLPTEERGYWCYLFNVELIGYLPNGVQMNQIELSGNRFSTMVEKKYSTFSSVLKAYFLKEAKVISNVLAKRASVQIKEILKKVKTHKYYELRFINYSMDAKIIIGKILASIKDVKVEKIDYSSVGLEPLIYARIFSEIKEKNAGDILLNTIYEKLKNTNDPESNYGEKLTPINGCYKKDNSLIFKR